MPEMVELASSPFVTERAGRKREPVTARLVDVAFVEVEVITVSPEIVDDALSNMPVVVVGVRYPFASVH